MNSRDAKRLAYRRAATVLESARGEGWPFNEGGDLDDIAAADAARIERALDAIISALDRRG